MENFEDIINRKWNKKLSIYKCSIEVLEELDIRDLKDQSHREEDSEYSIRKYEEAGDVMLKYEIKTDYGIINCRFSLSNIAFETISFFQSLFSNETASDVLKPPIINELKKQNIDIFNLFKIEESKVEEAIEKHTKAILKIFIANIPTFTNSAIIESYEYSKIGYFQHNMRSMLKNHWEQLGLPPSFNLMTKDELDAVKNHLLNERRWFLGDKKQLLSIETLADESDYLRIEYKKARNRYSELKENSKRFNKVGKKWADKWEEIRFDEFPMLNLVALNEIENEDIRPFELARKHLADEYGYDEETIKRKITQSRKMRGKRSKRG